MVKDLEYRFDGGGIYLRGGTYGRFEELMLHCPSTQAEAAIQPSVAAFRPLQAQAYMHVDNVRGEWFRYYVLNARCIESFVVVIEDIHLGPAKSRWLLRICLIQKLPHFLYALTH
jgi:hypothetical protein